MPAIRQATSKTSTVDVDSAAPAAARVVTGAWKNTRSVDLNLASRPVPEQRIKCSVIVAGERLLLAVQIVRY
jgi:hypothetical protein